MSILYLVVNLRRSVDRRANISRNLSALNQSFEIVNAIDATDGLDELACSVDQVEVAKNPWMTPGAVACALSHICAYEHFLSTDYEWCVVSEDDVLFNRKMTDVISPALSRLSQDDVYFLHFQGKVKSLSAEASVALNQGYSFNAVIDFHDQYGAVAYMLHRSLAFRLLEHLVPVKTASDRWDLFQASGILRGGWALLPQVSRPSHFGSDIGYGQLGKLFRGFEQRIPGLGRGLSAIRSRRRTTSSKYILVDQKPAWCGSAVPK